MEYTDSPSCCKIYITQCMNIKLPFRSLIGFEENELRANKSAFMGV